VGEALDRIVARIGGPSVASASAVFAGWEKLVGEDIAAHARPISLRGGVLTLEVENPAWATQLRYMSEDLLGRITGSARPGGGRIEVSEIRIRVAAGSGGDPSERRRGGSPAGRSTGGRKRGGEPPESP
jgi:predicted nucleic acid-binding Zn ribbon protein